MARVLIVEDETGQPCMLSDLLASFGYEAVAASGSQDAAEVAEWFRPDVVVSDCHMRQDRTGLETAEALRTALPDLRLIFVTPEPADRLVQEAGCLQAFQVANQPWGSENPLGAAKASLD